MTDPCRPYRQLARNALLAIRRLHLAAAALRLGEWAAIGRDEAWWMRCGAVRNKCAPYRNWRRMAVAVVCTARVSGARTGAVRRENCQ